MSEVAQQASTVSKQRAVDFSLECVLLPVSDVDRAKSFYQKLDWRLDADFKISDAFRIIQFTPPGSNCSILMGTGVTSAAPGSAQCLLVVKDIDAARGDLVMRGVNVSEVYHRKPGAAWISLEGRVPGADPEHDSYFSFADFSDPDGNLWHVQQVIQRLPGR